MAETLDSHYHSGERMPEPTVVSNATNRHRVGSGVIGTKEDMPSSTPTN